MKKRILSCLMALALCLTLLPAAALAEEAEGTAQTPPAVEEPADPANGGAKQENQPAEQGEQQEDPAAKQAVAAVQAMIDALPDVEALDGMDDEDAMAVYEAFQTACEAYYETLTEEQQAQLKNTEKLAALSDWFNAQVAPLENSGDIFPDTVDADGSIIRHTSWRRNGPIYEGGDGDADFTDGQSYVVQGSDVTIHGNLTVGGIGTLILCQGAKLTVEGALICSGSYSIYGQSDKGNNAGRLVIKNSLNENGGAAIRSDSTYPPSLGIYSGELEIYSGNSDKLVDGVKLSSTSHIHQGTLDGTAVSPEVWGETSLKGGTLTLAYCQHEYSADQKLIPDSGGTAHHRHCEACGFDWGSEACDFDNPDHYVPNPKDRANTHLPVCECGNVSTTTAKHEPTAIQTDDGKGHTQRCIYCFYTPTENNPVEEHHYNADGKCENCGFKPAARDEAGNLYEKVTAALKAAEDGSWVMLETQAEDDGKELCEEIEFNDPGKTVELKMNGYTLTNSGNPTLTVENGTLKITGDAVINQTGRTELAAPAVKVTGGELIFTGALTATGASGKPAVLVTNGTLRLKEGDVLNGGVSVEGSTAYANVNALLGDGLAFAKEDEHSIIVVKGNVKSIDENVVVKEHGHSFTLDSDGKYTCVCGYTCPHNDFEDGKCTICGNGCAHTDVDKNGVCENCKTQMAVKSETGGTVTYGTDFKAAMKAAENGTTVKLLADVSIANRTGISGNDTTVTLDLNGHKITSGWLDVGGNDNPTSCTLKIIGKGSYEPPMYGGIITVNMKATLDLSGWEGGTISSINISDNSNYEAATREAAVIVGPKAGTIGKLSFGNNQLDELKKTKLSGGSFNEIWVAGFGPVKLGELLAEGYAYQYTDGVDRFVEYTKILQGESIYNVKVVKCPHADAKDGTCLYCGTTDILARVGDTTYDDVGTAVRSWLANGGTLKLYADYGQGAAGNDLDLSSAKARGLAIDLNGHTFYKDCNGAIKLGGNTLTITDSSGKGTGVFGPVTADRGTLTLESGHLEGLTVPSGSEPTILLKGGKLTGISCPVPIFNLLPDGYALMDGNIPVDPTRTIYDSKTYTVKDSTNLYIGSQKEGSAAIGSDTIPFALSLKTNDKDIGQMGFTWYIVKEDGTTQKLAATTSDVTPGTNGVYTCNAANMTVDPNGWTDLEVNKTYNVLCVVSGKAPDGAYRWQTPMRGYKLTVTKIDLANATVTIDPWLADGKFRFVPNASETVAFAFFSTITVTANGEKYTLKENDYTYEGATATQVGKYTLTITAKDSCAKFKGSKAIPWEVIPYQLHEPSFLGKQTYTKTYDGTTTLPEYTFRALFPGKGSDSEVDWREDKYKNNYEVTAAEFVSADAGENKPINQTITLKNENFVFAPTEMINIKGITTTDKTITYTNFTPIETYPTLETTFNIEKADAPAAREGALEVINNHADTYTVDLAALLPKLESPRTYGEIEYSQPTVQLASGYYTDGNAKVENGKLILTIDKNPVTTTGPIGTVTVQVTTTNYKPVTLTVNLQSVNKRKLGMFVSVATDPVVYGMTLGDIKLSAEATDGDQVIPGTIAWEDPLTTVPAAGRATYHWTFTPDDTMHYLTASNTITFLVDKATPTGAPAYAAITTGGKTLADAPLTPNASWPSGTVQWVDKDGKPLPASTQVQANTEYTWSFTPADTANYNGATGSVTLYTVSHGGGGGGSSSGGSDSNPVTKTETKNHADGSVTKTETKKNGTKVETTTKPDGSVTKVESKPDGSSVTENKAADGSTGTVKTDKNGQTEAETTISGKAIEDAKKNGEAVKAPVEVKATRNSSTAPTVSIELPKGAGETKVEIPVTNVKPGTVAILVHADGTEEIVKNSLPTEDGIQLTVNGGATVKIVDNSKDFIDTRAHWAKDAIDFVSARGLVNGMNDSIYAPNASTTRAQLWTILARQNDANLNGGNTWYENAQNWAKAKGISDGANPNADINRAQMVTMLWRAEGQPAAGGAATFTDVSADSYYAQAVAWAIENGITTGVGGGKFDPNTTCTRAQIAAFLYRYMK